MRMRIPALSLLCVLACTPVFASTVIYTDGPTLGTTNAFYIDGPNAGPFSQNISDSFIATTTGVADSFDAGIWVLTGTTPTALSWWLGTSAFAGDISSGSTALVASTFFGTTGFGYDVYNVHVGGLSGLLTASNSYWFTLGNANDSSGSQFVAWDVNGGPSTCNFAVGGNSFGDCGACGEAFTIYAGDVPEPATLTLLGLGLIGAVRRRVRR